MKDKPLFSYYLNHDGSIVEMWRRTDGSVYKTTFRLGILIKEEVIEFIDFQEMKDE